jgi:hypothetical protein
VNIKEREDLSKGEKKLEKQGMKEVAFWAIH